MKVDSNFESERYVVSACDYKYTFGKKTRSYGGVNTAMAGCVRCGTFISVCNQLPTSTQPGHPFVGRHNEYRPKGGDALRLVSKGRYGLCVGGR